MAFNKREHLERNIRALEVAFSDRALEAYSGFGALKCVLRPAEKDEDISH